MQSRSRVVEGIDGGVSVKVKIALPVHSFEQVAEEGRYVGGPQCGVVILGDDEEILGQRKLSLSQQRAGLGQQLLRLAARGEGDVALAADGEQERVNAGCVDGVNLAHAGKQRRDERAGQLVHQLAEDAVLLRRAADHGEGPDRVAAMVDATDV